MRIYSLCDIGSRHAELGLVNQDRIAFAESRGVAVFAVADGMGAYRQSHLGAEIAVGEAVGAIASCVSLDRFEESAKVAVQAAFWAARSKIIRQATPEEKPCTLMVGAFNEASRQLAYGYVGDGMLSVWSGGQAVLPEKPQKGKLLNQTNSIFSIENWRFGFCDDVHALVCASDGIGDALLGASVEYSFSSLLEEMALGLFSEERFNRLFPADSSRWSEGFFKDVNDDRSLLAIVGSSSAVPEGYGTAGMGWKTDGADVVEGYDGGAAVQ